MVNLEISKERNLKMKLNFEIKLTYSDYFIRGEVIKKRHFIVQIISLYKLKIHKKCRQLQIVIIQLVKPLAEPRRTINSNNERQETTYFIFKVKSRLKVHFPIFKRFLNSLQEKILESKKQVTKIDAKSNIFILM